MNDGLKTARAADHLARRLYEAGCRYAFGMPGGEVLTLVDALEKAGIRFILCKHENNAGFMAEGVHHRDGAPAILVATVGPGVVNGVNVVANAMQDRVPMLVLSGCVDADEAQTYTHQVFDHQQVFRSITKETFRLTAKSADIIADKAVNIALEGRAGPVHIDVPISVADEEVTLRPRRRAAMTRTVPCEGADLATARDWLAAAQRPVMVVGLDAVAEGASAQVQAFAEHYNMPVITTYKAKGIIPEDHGLALGGAGLSPLNDRHLIPFLQSADLILCAGYDPIEMRTGWREIWDPSRVNVIDITAEPNTHYMHQAGLSFVAGTGETLDLLRGGGPAGRDTWRGGEVAKLKSDLAAAFPLDAAWGPAAVMDECRKALPRNALATVDSGAHRILLSQLWQCYEPRGLIQSTALCTMGCALPMAIGEKLASPDRQVISFSGDAGALMVMGELSTAKELGGNPIFVVFVDASLALIEIKQRGRQMTNAGVDFGQHDFAAIGRAFGGHGVTVQDRAALRDALAEAQSAETFTVIAAVIDRHSYDGLF
ncbi:Acetolactate synthase large subunit [Candidatus Rhodobacter oscarellae]|uniref:Acetolactate synthase large subunit n=1 Tax=Candidatus Rhodobacter oscarellae TaxID=1675527 RepID=A0A0J9E774_9RHOB|nr:thiamine pyrophosphate-binding protein [Candidatus Rhodobacter lobularis]KMW57624.1 Acetolactate synthase large subunit [Candidatus Rhodobacter lobularis]